MSVCNWDCRWMGTQSPGLPNLAIGERWAGYETHSPIRRKIQPK
ncbi:hypothetical protein Gotur_004316 [Gossypium turneri]